jgi:hypothetical protein
MACIMCFYWHSAASVSMRDHPAQTLAPPSIVRMLPGEQDRHLNRTTESRPTAP